MRPTILPANVLPNDSDASDRSDVASPEQQQALYELVMGYRVSQALGVVAKLGIANLLAAGPQGTAELAQATKTHAPTLFRLLRFLAGVGVFDEVAPHRFALTPLGAGLRTDIAGSIGSIALHVLGESQWQAWSQLLHSVQTGDTAFEHVHGMGNFAYFREHPDTAAIFNQAMTSFTARWSVAITQSYDWSGIAQVVDVGGGRGLLLATVLQAHPTMRGVLFDRPEVVASARAVLEQAGVAERCEVVGGDFFTAVPAGGDAYVLKSVIQDWEDAEARLILVQCRKAIGPEGRLLLVQRVVGTDYRDAMPALQNDMQMLVGVGGRERTEAEHRALFAEAGFRLTNVLGLEDADGMCIIEGAPA
jgi:hypothetical protein